MREVSWRARVGAPVIVVLALAGAFVAIAGSPASGATTFGPVDHTIPDGNANSLRDILENQVADGDTVALQSGTIYTLDDCKLAEINIKASITLQGNGATIRQTCSNTRVLEDSHDLVMTGTTLTGGSDEGGGLNITDGSTWSISNSVFTANNNPHDDGGGLDLNTTGTLTITNSTFANNHTHDDGGAFDCEGDGSTVTITGSTFSGNTTDAGSGLSGGAIDLESTCSLTLVNSTVTGNNGGDDGAVTSETTDGTVTLVYDTIVNNTIGGVTGASAASGGQDPADARVSARQTSTTGANVVLDTPANLTAFGTVVALPQNGANCSDQSDNPLSGITDHGFNFSDDASCGFTAASDKQNAGDPGLGALANNGGPTETMLPQTGSPLIDAIPVSDCGGTIGVATDQRGVTRPQGSGCDIGAVEVEVPATPVTVQPAFTG